MKTILLLLSIICLFQAQENKTGYYDLDCTEVDATLEYDGTLYGCGNSDPTTTIQVDSYNRVRCSYNYGNNWYQASKCKTKDDYDNCEDPYATKYYWRNGFKFGCPKGTSYIQVYKSKNDRFVALCDNQTLAQTCREGYYDSSNILKMFTLTFFAIFIVAFI